jgi:hypothetical protein
MWRRARHGRMSPRWINRRTLFSQIPSIAAVSLAEYASRCGAPSCASALLPFIVYPPASWLQGQSRLQFLSRGKAAKTNRKWCGKPQKRTARPSHAGPGTAEGSPLVGLLDQRTSAIAGFWSAEDRAVPSGGRLSCDWLYHEPNAAGFLAAI